MKTEIQKQALNLRNTMEKGNETSLHIADRKKLENSTKKLTTYGNRARNAFLTNLTFLAIIVATLMDKIVA
jgi:hypothetical protein